MAVPLEDSSGQLRTASRMPGQMMNELDPSEAESLEVLAECLRQLRIRADSPTLRELEQRTKHAKELLPGSRLKRARLGRTKLSDVLAGRTFPGKAFLLTFVDMCGVDLEKDSRWEQAWDRLAPRYLAQGAVVGVEQLRQQVAAAQAAQAKAEHGRRAAEETMQAAQVEVERLRAELIKLRAELERVRAGATAPIEMVEEAAKDAQLSTFAAASAGSGFTQKNALVAVAEVIAGLGPGMTQLALPTLDERITEGVVTRWLKEEGDHVELGEPLLEISAHRDDVDEVVEAECPSPDTGFLRKIIAGVGETVAIGGLLGVIEPLLEVSTEEVDTEIPWAATGILRGIGEDNAVAVGTQLAVMEPAPSPAVTRIWPVRMPQLNGVTRGTVTRWLKKEGEHIDVNEPLIEIATEWMDIPIPSPATGILRGIAVDEDNAVAVGTQLAVIEETQPASEESGGNVRGRPIFWDDPCPCGSGHEYKACHGTRDYSLVQPPNDTPYITPLVRKLAAEHGVDLANVAGTGVNRRVRKEDLLDAARALRRRQPGA